MILFVLVVSALTGICLAEAYLSAGILRALSCFSASLGILTLIILFLINHLTP